MFDDLVQMMENLIQDNDIANNDFRRLKEIADDAGYIDAAHEDGLSDEDIDEAMHEAFDAVYDI